jgi:drug/metabolite transporter (DMT)-like permease
MGVNHLCPEQSPSAYKLAAAYVGCCLLGGTAYFSLRQQIGETGYPIYLAASVRFSGAALGYLLIARNTGGLQISRRDALYLVIGGLCSAFAHVFLYGATQHLQGSITTVLLATCPMVAAFLAWITRTEKITIGTIAGAAIATLGVVVVFVGRLQVPKELSALGYVCIAMVLTAFCNLALRRLHSVPVFTQGAIFFLASSPVLLCTYLGYLLKGEQLPPPWPLPIRETAWLAYTTFFLSGVAFAQYLWMMKYLGLMRTMSCAFFQIVVALVIDAVWESHSIDLVSYVGIIVIGAGVVLEWLLKGCPPRKNLTAKLGAFSANGSAAAHRHDTALEHEAS